MRIRATAVMAAVSGAVALTGAVLPAAQAATPGAAHGLRQAFHRALESRAAAPSGVRAAAAVRPADDGLPHGLDVSFGNLKVANGAAGVVIGTTNVVHVPYTFTATGHNVDMSPDSFMVMVAIYHASGGDSDGFAMGDEPATCTVTSGAGTPDTTASCKGTVDVHPADGNFVAAQAGPNYHVGIIAADLSDDDATTTAGDEPPMTVVEGLHSPAMMRYSKLTAHTSTKLVSKGHTAVISGALTRANWDTGKYAGYITQTVKLQFRKKTSTTYTTVKTLKTDSHGNVKYTVKPTSSGYWRYTFTATTTTPSVTATGTYVGLK